MLIMDETTTRMWHERSMLFRSRSRGRRLQSMRGTTQRPMPDEWHCAGLHLAEIYKESRHKSRTPSSGRCSNFDRRRPSRPPSACWRRWPSSARPLLRLRPRPAAGPSPAPTSDRPPRSNPTRPTSSRKSRARSTPSWRATTCTTCPGDDGEILEMTTTRRSA